MPRRDLRGAMPRLARTLLAAAAVLLAPAAAPAQGSPAQTVQALFDAMAARQWDSAAALFTPESAAWYQREQLGLNPRPAGDDEPGSRELRLPDPESVTRDDSIALGLIPGLGPAAELADLPPARFVALALRVWGGTLGFETATAPGARTVIGQVVENDSVAHVLYRVSPEAYMDGLPSAVRVVRLDGVDGRWLVRINRALFRSFGMMELYAAWKPPLAVTATIEVYAGSAAGACDPASYREPRRGQEDPVALPHLAGVSP
ncbi:MAG TPA: hypothetical protein VGB24_05200 [Longimicrobium sp.]|uniref:hypothetical protein n=1 Tax=Longimicrobium sp. TaxID=2029185 RepID=UPI002EDA7E19